MRRLALLGLLSEAAYVIFLVVPFPLARYVATPLLDLGKLTEYRSWQVVVIAMALIFMLYVSALRLPGSAAMARWVIVLGTLFAVSLALVYPIGALDVFDYLFAGREIVAYGANPYLVTPQDFAGDSLLRYVGWPALPFNYGPAWALVTAALNAIGRSNLLLNVLLLKGAGVLAYGLTAVIIYKTLQREAPERAFVGTVVFAWNPLVLFETAANGHNDIFVVLLLAAGLAAFAAGRRASSLVSLAVSVLVKFVTAPLGLIWLAAGLRAADSWKKRLLLAAGGGLAVLAVAALLYWPFIDSVAQARTVILMPVTRDGLFTSSFPALFYNVAIPRLGAKAAGAIARNTALIIFLAFTVYQAARVKKDWQDLTRASFDVLVFYLLFSCLWFQPWYVMWVAPLAALLPLGRRSSLFIAFCLSAMAKYLVFDFFWFWSPVQLSTVQIESVAVAAIYVLPLSYIIWTAAPRAVRMTAQTVQLLWRHDADSA